MASATRTVLSIRLRPLFIHHIIFPVKEEAYAQPHLTRIYNDALDSKAVGSTEPTALPLPQYVGCRDKPGRHQVKAAR